ncbi:hypothetical protein BAU14_07280 [Enterococcus sp. CU9D]|nr:hypothetical protein BAU14_07280 [Enterococcus sp. CU9D]
MQLERTAKQKDYSEVTMETRTYAQRFHEKLGYSPVNDEIPTTMNPIPHIVMRKELREFPIP